MPYMLLSAQACAKRPSEIFLWIVRVFTSGGEKPDKLGGFG